MKSCLLPLTIYRNGLTTEVYRLDGLYVKQWTDKGVPNLFSLKYTRIVKFYMNRLFKPNWCDVVNLKIFRNDFLTHFQILNRRNWNCNNVLQKDNEHFLIQKFSRMQNWGWSWFDLHTLNKLILKTEDWYRLLKKKLDRNHHFISGFLGRWNVIFHTSIRQKYYPIRKHIVPEKYFENS